jgi:anion-transporting  ArsA/GET3 family ATPase
MARPNGARDGAPDAPEHKTSTTKSREQTQPQGRPPGQAPTHPSGGSLDGLLASREIVVACGPGGVGKTTTAAAAAAMAAWRHGGKVLVLTIDPARRLADALGLAGIGNQESRVPDEAFTRAGVRPRGELWAAMLDTKESWDSLIRMHAPDERTRDEILKNPLYSQISSRFVQSHDYIAMERLYEIHAGGDYDLIVVDTPPTRNALDFLDAPERMAEFFSSRLLRWLIVPYRSRLVNVASRPFYQIADRILGTQFLGDISQFFILFQTMYDGFIERAQSVGRLLADRRTTFVVVATLEAAPLREAQVFVRELGRRDLHVGAVVLNKVLPEYLRDPSGRMVAEKLKDGSDVIAEKLVSDPGLKGVDESTLARVLHELGSSYLDYNVVAQREAEQRAEMANVPDVLVSVPFFDTDVYDMEGLLRLGEQLWS